MRCRRAASLLIFGLVGLLFVSTPIASAQLSKEKFVRLITDDAALSAGEITTLNNGDFLVKVLKLKDKRKVSVFGAVRLRDVQSIDLAAFREVLSQRDNRALLDGGRLSSPPVLQDLAALTLKDKDIESIKNCIVGKCDLKLSARMIRRFQTEVDWNSAQQEIQATSLFKQMLVEYSNDYSKRGDQALIEYVDQKDPVRLVDEYRVLLEQSVMVHSLAPEFVNYLKKFPALELSGAESRLDWSNVDSGLKPIVTLTHSLGYSRKVNDDLVLTLATKQIYASHYVDASLGFSWFIRLGAGESAETYLIFTSISRSDSLGGVLSGMAHAVVEKEAMEKVEDLLKGAKKRLEMKQGLSTEPVKDVPESWLFSTISSLTQSPIFRILALLIAVGIAGFVLLRSRAGKTS